MIAKYIIDDREISSDIENSGEYSDEESSIEENFEEQN